MLKHLANHLPYFSAVAKHLSFSNAATELAVTQSSISYQIKSLEDKLGFKLFARGQGSKVALTEKGAKLYHEYIVLERNFNQVVSDTQLSQHTTKIELTAPVDLGVKLITPALAMLGQKTLGQNTTNQPELIVNLDLSDNLVDLKKSRFDFSIRNNTDEPELTYLPLLSVKNKLICSQRYAAQQNITTFAQLQQQHRLIVRNATKSNTWETLFSAHNTQFAQHQNRQVINNSFGIYQAIMADAGIAILAEYFIDKTNRQLLHVFDDKISQTEFFLAFQPSYIANKWAELVKAQILAYAAEKPANSLHY
ncbi:LysR family transcriptional regulator [Shewanella litoralis]|uniref:HTH lysR-type domain-containing protein n=1 Tax=Shewanella litoralis TaxID=2282700 RepID=A0ABQ2QYM8_9GAMM|nr:LysR family transcriptional regulator [Shewanella litoralis]GGQ04731.1 hypothetical protein GCM10009411_02390 [Shewanella litoralis]